MVLTTGKKADSRSKSSFDRHLAVDCVDPSCGWLADCLNLTVDIPVQTGQ